MTDLTKDGKRLAVAVESVTQLEYYLDYAEMAEDDVVALNTAAALLLAAPEGWKLVPIKLPRHMKDAVAKQVDDFSRDHARLFVADIWDTLLAEAPPCDAAPARSQSTAPEGEGAGLREALEAMRREAHECRDEAEMQVPGNYTSANHYNAKAEAFEEAADILAATLTPAAPKTPDVATGDKEKRLFSEIFRLREALWKIAKTRHSERGEPFGYALNIADAALAIRDLAQPAPGGSVGDGGLREALADKLAFFDKNSLEDRAVYLAEADALIAGPLAALAQPAPVGEDETGVRSRVVADCVRRTERFWQAVERAPQPPKAETPAGEVDTLFKANAAYRSGYDAVYRPGWQGEAHQAGIKAVLALSTAPAARPGDEVQRVRHVKSGGVYEVLGDAEAQVSVSRGWRHFPSGVDLSDAIPAALIHDGVNLTVYRDIKSGKLWCRFTDEFRDGRFVPAAAPAADGGRA